MRSAPTFPLATTKGATFAAESKPIKYLSKKALHEARNSRVIPELREEDLEEKFVQGALPFPFSGRSLHRV